jgi:hypothetical protein
VWHEPTGRYLDSATGEFLPTWDEALDAIGANDEPLHVARFGPKFDAGRGGDGAAGAAAGPVGAGGPVAVRRGPGDRSGAGVAAGL